MNIKEQEDALFEEWRNRRPDLVTDGAIDAAKWSASTPRIVFVLKEANSKSGGWDERECIRNGEWGRSPTFRNLARWSIGIRALPEEMDWSRLERISRGEMAAALLSTCVMNLRRFLAGVRPTTPCWSNMLGPTRTC